MANQSDIASCIHLVCAAFPNYSPDVKATAELWTLVLGDLPADTLKAATLAATMPGTGRQFAPSADEIRTKAAELHALAAGIPDAYRAYEEVEKMPADMTSRKVVEENGENIIYEKALQFTHPIVESVARSLGWPKTFPTENPGVDRGQFRQAYETEVRRVMGDAGRLPLLQDYIEGKRAELTGKTPALVTKTAKLLERK